MEITEANVNRPAFRRLNASSPPWLRACLGVVAGVLTVSAALWCLWPSVSGIATYANGKHESVALMPWRFHDDASNAKLEVTLHTHFLSPTAWRVVPDDELLSMAVNGEVISLKNISADALRDWDKGFEMDLRPWLKPGDNRLEFVLNNHGGDGGILLHPKLGWRWILVWTSLLPWLYALINTFKLRLHQWLPIAFAMGVTCCYWSITPWTVRAHDVWGGDGHIDYVMRVADTLTLPAPNESWEFFQAPLYYVGGAIALRWSQWLSLPAAESLQAYSLFLWMIFLAASAATFHIVLKYRASLTLLATATLSLWPSGIIASISINNDVGLYACSGVSTWLLLKWWYGNQQRHLLLASLFIALALLTKTSALVLTAAAVTLMLFKALRKEKWRDAQVWTINIFAAAMMSAGFLLSVGRKIYFYRQGLIHDWITGDSATMLGEWLKVPARFVNFIPMDIATFLSHPWTELTHDESGRANFWNLLLRTSLTGEFTFIGDTQTNIAYLWGVLLLILFASTLLSLPRAFRGSNSWRHAPLLLLSALWLASLISFRANIPYSCNNDFRYVLPILVPFIVAVMSINTFNKVLLLLFSALSIVFFATAQYG